MSNPTSLLHLDALPRQTTKGTIVRLLEQVGEIDKLKIGAIEVRGRSATVEVPTSWLSKLVKALDGANLANQFIRAWGASSPSIIGVEDHFQRLMKWIELESRAEADATLHETRRRDPALAEQTGASLVDLVMRDEFLGLGGRVLVTLGKRDASQPLPWTRLGIGAPILLSEQRAADNVGWRGVVSDLDGHVIQVAVTQSPEPTTSRPLFRLDLSTDEVARQRQQAALQRARSASGDRLAQLRSVLLGERPPQFRQIVQPVSLNHQLNESQRQAVDFALSAQDVAIIHGPPGTGKTTTVVELIRQAVRRGDKVLACAPSNLAVDNMLERLLAAGEKAVRLGHPARVLLSLREHTLDLMVERHDDVKLTRKLVREASILRNRASKFTRAKPEPGAKREMREEARQLMADARRLEAMIVQQILDQADVLCATTTGLDSEILGQRAFDLAVIDEASQSTEPGCWIPLLRSERLVLAGDPCQLPPTVVSVEAAREGFAVSLLERLMELHGPSVSRLLITQYRMHEQIMEFSSDEFYEGMLVADQEVRHHVLADLPGITSGEWTTHPADFIDTAGASFDEQLEPDGESRWNPQEAEIVIRLVHGLLNLGVQASDIGVISPYAAQVRYLRERLLVPLLEIDTIDGFQGREKEAIVVSLVRSNSNGEIGFLADVRRMNVALTRARRKLVVIGDSATVAHHAFYQRLLEYFERIGAYRTVWEWGEF